MFVTISSTQYILCIGNNSALLLLLLLLLPPWSLLSKGEEAFWRNRWLGALSGGGPVELFHLLLEGLASLTPCPPAGGGHGDGDMETWREGPESWSLPIAQPRRGPMVNSLFQEPSGASPLQAAWAPLI